MGYYKQLAKMQRLVESLAQQGISLEDICFLSKSRFQIGEKATTEYYEQVKEKGHLIGIKIKESKK